MIKKVFAAALMALLTGCAGSMDTMPVVHAAGSPPHPITLAHQLALCTEFATTGNCPAGYLGAESPGNYLALRIGPQTDMSQTEFVYTLSVAMHVAQIDGWLDYGFQSVEEGDTHLQIQFPDGTYTEFYSQYDRHSASLPGEIQRVFPVNLDLPIGTKLVMYHNTGSCISPAVCGYDSLWQLRSK